MVTKVNGMAKPGQGLTGGLNFYTVRTLLDIRPTGNMADEAQVRLDKLVQTISMRAAPVILGDVVVTSEAKADIVDLPAAAAAPGTDVDVYTLKFAIEHDLAWELINNDPSLAESLNGVAGFVFTFPTDDNNVSVAMNPVL